MEENLKECCCCGRQDNLEGCDICNDYVCNNCLIVNEDGEILCPDCNFLYEAPDTEDEENA